MLKGTLTLIKESWILYKSNFWLFIGYTAWLLIPLSAYVIISFLPEHWLTLTAAVATSIVEIFLGLCITVIVLRLASTLVQKKSPQTKTIFQESLKRIPQVLATACLQFLIVLGGFLLLIIPGLVFYVWYSFAQLGSAIDDLRPTDALCASRDLVRGRFMHVLWRLISGPVFIFACYALILGAILTSLATLSGIDPMSIFNEQAPVWAIVIEGVGEIILCPLLLSYCVVMYQNLKDSFQTKPVEPKTV